MMSSASLLKSMPTEEESFIILGTSPGTSLDMKCNGNDSLDRTQLNDAMKDVGPQASMAFKAHFKLGDCPSPGSVMVASTIITDDKTTEQLQKSFGEILDENVILKETLKQNNESMKEQFLLIASCQEDMLRTHKLHKEKFDETRELVEKLRQENKKLRLDLSRLAESEQPDQLPSHQLTQSQTSQKSQQSLTASQSSTGSKSGPSSALEFVTSPDDDMINKLTAQLELVEKQRRQVIVENDKLTWQKESLEHIVDATSKERDELRDKLKHLQLQMSSTENENAQRIELLNLTIQEMNVRLQEASNKPSSSEEIMNRDAIIQQLETKVRTLQNDLKNAQLKILDLENVKLEFSKHKSGVSDTVRMYKDQIQELQNRLKEAQTTVFQPVRFSISSEGESSSEFTTLMNNVKLYDKALKHLAELLNLITHGSSDTLAQAVGTCASIHEYRLERATAGDVTTGLADLKAMLVKQHAKSLANVTQVKSTLSIFEGIFKDCNELIKKSLTKQQHKSESSNNVETLTAALLARGQELLAVKTELAALKADKEDKQLLKAQLDLYKSDFEAERDAREKMASEKETILTDLRKTQRKNEELLMQLEEVRKLNPNIHKSATLKRLPTAPQPQGSAGTATGNMVYTCPKCMRFSSDQYKVMEEHFDFCLDDF